MRTKKSATAIREKLIARITATQREAGVAKKNAKLAKLGLRHAKDTLKAAKRTAKKLRKALKSLKSELAALGTQAKSPAKKRPAAKPAVRRARKSPAPSVVAPREPVPVETTPAVVVELPPVPPAQ